MDRHLPLAPRAPWRLASWLMALGLALGLPAGPVHGQSCKADPAWFLADAPEPDSKKPRPTNCEFHQWAVQELLYQVQTVDGRARFLGLASPHSLFLYSGDKPAPYPGSKPTLFKLGAGMAQLPSTGKANAASPLVFLPRTLKTDDTTFDGVTQAGSNAVLVDQKGQWVYYTSTINQAYYNFVVDKGYYTLEGLKAAPKATTFPVGALETKSAWRIASIEGEPAPYIPDAAKSYYMTDARICRAYNDEDGKCTSFVSAKMALVGLHLAGVVQGHPEMVWATFEHKDNVPDCKDTPAKPKDAYSFYTSGQDCGGGSCNQKPTDNTKPSEVCRVHPYGEPEASVDTKNIRALSQSFRDQADSVWRNYDYVGATWTEGNTGADGLIVFSEIRGSSKLANTSLESFTQEQNCFSCHSSQPVQMGSCLRTTGLKNLYLSHLVGLVCKRSKLLASH